MKNQWLNSIRFGLICLSLALAFGLSTCSFGQSVQAMVKHQPFPFAQGVAMDTVLYKSVKAKLAAAESLKYASEQSMTDLQAEITATQTALADQRNLMQYDGRKLDSLTSVIADRTTQLDATRSALKTAQKTIDGVVGTLPRRIRKTLVLATPEAIATAVTDYLHLLKIRKWKWAGVSALAGGLGTGVLLILR